MPPASSVNHQRRNHWQVARCRWSGSAVGRIEHLENTTPFKDSGGGGACGIQHHSGPEVKLYIYDLLAADVRRPVTHRSQVTHIHVPIINNWQLIFFYFVSLFYYLISYCLCIVLVVANKCIFIVILVCFASLPTCSAAKSHNDAISFNDAPPLKHTDFCYQVTMSHS